MSDWTDQELVAMPRVNLALLDEVLDYIIEHPDEWYQSSWGEVNEESPCGTTLCFAGQACRMTGHEIERVPDTTYELQLVGGLSWESTAQAELGLTWQESSALFLQTMFPRSVEDEKLDCKVYQLKNVKYEVERIRYRAKMQEEAFNRIAQEFIDAAGLDDVLAPGYKCPESVEAVQRITGGTAE